MAKKIDWTKPLLHNSLTRTVDATYHGPTKDVRTPHLVSAEISPGEVRVDLVDHFGRDCFGAQIVTNAPEPNELQNGLWANINRDSGGNLYLDLSVYRTRADAKRAAGPSHFKSIRLSTVPFIGSGPSEDDGLDQ